MTLSSESRLKIFIISCYKKVFRPTLIIFKTTINKTVILLIYFWFAYQNGMAWLIKLTVILAWAVPDAASDIFTFCTLFTWSLNLNEEASFDHGFKGRYWFRYYL